MHSSVPIGVAGRDPVTGINPVPNNYAEFLWCGPNNGNTNLLGGTDENYNIDTGSSYHRLNDQMSPATNSHSSYYDFHSHHNTNTQSGASVGGGGGLTLNIGGRNDSMNEHTHLGPTVGHHHLQPHHQHYGQMMETLGSEAEECCSSGSGPGEYYITAARSPTDSAYEMWNCHNNNNSAASSHLHHSLVGGDGGTSVGHPSPEEDPLLISPNDDDDDGTAVVGGISRDANGGLVMTPRATPRRRNTANKKERRRTMSINNAFADLRDCIPNVPADTKLSKIKTLRLATSYIAYLSDVLSGDDPSRTPAAFTAEISRKLARGDEKRKKELLLAELNNSNHHHSHSRSSSNTSVQQQEGHNHHHHHRKTKGRTGWPQHVWALELQQ